MLASAGKGDSVNISRDKEEEQRKRRRISYACEHCRTKKNRCDGERPACSPCRTRQLHCVYSAQKPRANVTKEYVDNLTTRNRMLEQQLATYRKSQDTSTSSYIDADGVSSDLKSHLVQDGPTQNGSTRPSSDQRSSRAPVSSPIPSFFPRSLTSSAQPERSTPGIQTIDSVNNSTRSTVAAYSTLPGGRQDDSQNPVDHAPQSAITEGSVEYFGESSTFDFMTKICSPENDQPKQHLGAVRRVELGSVDASLAMSSPSEPIFEGLVLGAGNDDPFGLPHRFVADKLIDAYFKFRHPLNSYLHEPSFRSRYERLWLSQDLGGEEATEANLAWIGLVNLVFAFGSAHAQVTSRISVDRIRFFKRARTLVFSSLLQASSVDHVQALLLMGQYLHGTLELNNCWTVVGLAIRMAQGLGLHLDASTFTSNIIEQEIRKRVWWSCFVLDRILSMKIGRLPTIQDGPSIEVGLPLTVDDEYLTNDESKPQEQPPNVPSKLDFLVQAVPQCRLLKQICDMLYSRNQTDISKQNLTDIPTLLSKAIELDGNVTAWQQALPVHLKADSLVEGWHFERQRNTLIMRSLNSRLLLHRPILLIYVTRRITDDFQRGIMYCCVQRCIIAAHETIKQMRLLYQRRLLHSWWHNSHYVFTALSVMLAFRTLDATSKQDVNLPISLDVDQAIVQGTELLEEVGGQLHPIATRYLEALQRMEAKLKNVSACRTKMLDLHHLPTALPSEYMQRRHEVNANPVWESMDDAFGESFQQTGDTSIAFGEDFLEIENMFYNTGWLE